MFLEKYLRGLKLSSDHSVYTTHVNEYILQMYKAFFVKVHSNALVTSISIGRHVPILFTTVYTGFKQLLLVYLTIQNRKLGLKCQYYKTVNSIGNCCPENVYLKSDV